jgi:uncharacterized coiled-coil protein SlyX
MTDKMSDERKELFLANFKIDIANSNWIHIASEFEELFDIIDRLKAENAELKTDLGAHLYTCEQVHKHDEHRIATLEAENAKKSETYDEAHYYTDKIRFEARIAKLKAENAKLDKFYYAEIVDWNKRVVTRDLRIADLEAENAELVQENIELGKSSINSGRIEFQLRNRIAELEAENAEKDKRIKDLSGKHHPEYKQMLKHIADLEAEVERLTENQKEYIGHGEYLEGIIQRQKAEVERKDALLTKIYRECEGCLHGGRVDLLETSYRSGEFVLKMIDDADPPKPSEDKHCENCGNGHKPENKCFEEPHCACADCIHHSNWSPKHPSEDKCPRCGYSPMKWEKDLIPNGGYMLCERCGMVVHGKKPEAPATDKKVKK